MDLNFGHVAKVGVRHLGRDRTNDSFGFLGDFLRFGPFDPEATLVDELLAHGDLGG